MLAPKTILFVSHTHWQSDFVVGSHHLARELSRAGHRVARMVTPLSLAHTVLRRAAAGNSLRRWARGTEIFTDGNGVTNVRASTVLPVQWSTGAHGRRTLARIAIERADLVFVDQPLMLGRWLFELGAPVIYRRTDIYTGSDYLRKESRWVNRVDGVVGTSEPTLTDLRAPRALPSAVIPNGVQAEHFTSAFRPWNERQGVIYVGALDLRFDWDGLRAIAMGLPHLNFTIVGPFASAPPLPGNVSLVGPVAYDDLPHLVAHHRVALLPFSAVRENAGRSPMKLFELIAAGLHVVVSRHLSARPPGCEALVSFYSTVREAVDLVERAHDQEDPRSDQLELASQQDWARKADELLAFGCKIAGSRS